MFNKKSNHGDVAALATRRTAKELEMMRLNDERLELFARRLEAEDHGV